MLRLTVRGSDSRSDQMALSETLTSSSSLLSPSPMSALVRSHCGLKSDSAPSSKSAKGGHRRPLDAVRTVAVLYDDLPLSSQSQTTQMVSLGLEDGYRPPAKSMSNFGSSMWDSSHAETRESASFPNEACPTKIVWRYVIFVKPAN